MANIKTNMLKKIFYRLLVASMALVLCFGGLVIPLKGEDVLASNSAVDFQDFYTDDQGFLRVQVKFKQNITLCWQTWIQGQGGIYEHAYSYGDSSWGHQLKGYPANSYSGGLFTTLVPDLPSNITWQHENDRCIDYYTDNVVGFYVAKMPFSPVTYFNPSDDTSVYKSTDYEFTTSDYNYYNGNEITDSEQYFWTHSDYSAGPTLSITYPHLNQTNLITSPFTITGSYTNPNQDYMYLVAYLVDHDGFYVDQMIQTIGSTTSGDLSSNDMTLRSGLSAGDYTLTFYFATLDWNTKFDVVGSWFLRSIDNLPPLLPNGEAPPPAYQQSPADTYYTTHSNYSTSTPLYDAITGSVSPLLDSIGTNLNYFQNKFNLANAQSTGSSLGGAIVVARSYASNINQLFGSLPIAQTMIFYLVLLVAVGLFRLIKNLINLIKP